MEDQLSSKNNGLITFGPFVLDVAERTLHKNGQPVRLTRKVFDLLLILVSGAGTLQTRETLIDSLWPNSIVGEQSLATKMYALRKALGDNGKEPQYIETVRGVGYRFIAPVDARAEDSGKPAVSPVHRGRRWKRIAVGVGIVAALAVSGGILAWKGWFSPTANRTARAYRPAIAVLPFENLSADSSNAYFVSGMQDEILTRLAAVRSLRVISRTSTAGYASHPEDLHTVARELGISTVLEGSVQKEGDAVHINVQLINARTYAHIWAHSYDRKLDDVFDVEGEVAQEIADALRAKLVPGEAARLARPPTSDSQAYLAYLKANYLAGQVFSEENARDPAAAEKQAAGLYHRAISLDPGFAMAYARLSLMESRAFWFATSFESSVQHQRIAESERTARKALQLDADLPQAHLAMGFVEYYVYRHYAAALAQFEQARKGLPNNAAAVAAIGYVHRRQGKWKEALAELREAALLDPRNARRAQEVGITQLWMRRYAQARQSFTQVLAIEPHDYRAVVRLADIALLTGDVPRARAILHRIPDGVNLGGLISASYYRVAMYERKPDAALSALAKSPAWQMGVTYYAVPTSLMRARAWVLAGDHDRAGKAYAEALAALRRRLKAWPDDETVFASMGLAQAALGKDAEAVKAGIHATGILPEGADAAYGPNYQYVLAEIYAQVGDAARSTALLARLLRTPSAVGDLLSAATLRLDPQWDPIRNDPDFKALLREFGTGKFPATRQTLPSAASSH